MSEPREPQSVPNSPGSEEPAPMDLFDGAPRSVERIDRVLSLVRQEWLAHPDERFFQMTANLAARMGISAYTPILEDDALIDMLEQPERQDRSAAAPPLCPMLRRSAAGQ